jgi:cyclic beta-1,2-glucan synthetase
LRLSIPRAASARTPFVPSELEEPIRAELFSIERLEQHAASLAVAQQNTTMRGADRRLATRLRDNGRVLLDAYRAIGEAIREERAITPAAEWLIDNYHVAQEQIIEIRDDLPPRYYRGLPKLVDGPLKGYPRVFGIAWAFVAHTDSRFEPEMLRRFIHAYQRVQPLTIGELWAVAITLRVVLVENLRRSAEEIVGSRIARQEADALADRLLGLGGQDAESPEIALRQFDQAPLPRAFAVQLVQRLRDQDPSVTPALLWLDQRLSLRGTNANEIVREELQSQGATNVTVRNILTSMRLISAVDWTEIFESVSLVDASLRGGSKFAEMDFPTRDRYRHAIEQLARGSGISELDVSRRAVASAKRAELERLGAGDAAVRRTEEPGYYLISKGRRTFEKDIGFRVPLTERLVRAVVAAGILGYSGAIAIVTAIVLILPLALVVKSDIGGWMLILFALLALIPASDAAVALVNRAVTKSFTPRILPAMELRDGVPPSLRTIVVVPTLLTTKSALEDQITRLEVHYLASEDGDIHFALLSDWSDSDAETAPDDAELLAAATEGIARLNRRYGPAPDGARFLLFHRRRLWNEGQRKWIGWERKRGKLHELNRLLRGATDTTFLEIAGRPLEVPRGIRYVITLDADTRLPRGTAKRLIGKMSHPLNRPRLDIQDRRVVEGYAVLQPRVTPSFPSRREGTILQRVFSSPSGVDPYAFAVSDVYQDLFGEGSYSGKGIYDVDAFEAALEGRIPESTLLSHDLLEGIFARAGLLSDIEVVEEFPSRYDSAADRQHRWARGDWQLLPWILGLARDSSGGRRRVSIPLVGRWKMIDNLRRTLSAPSALLALFAGWTLPFGASGGWTGFVVATFAVPAFLPALLGIIPQRLGISQRSHWRAVGADFSLAISQIGLVVSLLCDQAWLMADAIARTLIRMLVSRRRLLEWVAADHSKLSAELDLGSYYRHMAAGVALGVLGAIIVVTVGRQSWPIAAPFVVLWVLSPAIARWASLPQTVAGDSEPSEADARTLRLVARRTWRFFETFVTAKHHMLPPDNYQEDPKPVLAHRTSPTNLGLYLLSVVTARDFGWVGTTEAVDRLDSTLGAMSRLERFRGHLYNWYDTHDLRPLEPKYVSSVDSGNLAGHLIALSNACREMTRTPLLTPEWLAGIEDALELMRESQRALTDDRRVQSVTRKHLDDAVDALAATVSASIAGVSSAPTTPADVVSRLAELAINVDTVVDIVRTLSGERGDSASAELLSWAESVRTSIQSHQRDLQTLMPWANLVAGDVGRSLGSICDSMPTVAELPIRCEAAVAILTRGGGPAGLVEAFERSAMAARSLQGRLDALAELAKKIFDAMEFGFLLDHDRQLLSIGFGATEGILDRNCYDLLASEAHLASFVAIAKGDIPARHWFRLGRAVTPVDSGAVLVSWSGSMFEYLMPNLVLRAPPGCLIEQTNRLVVRRQMDYGLELGLPWGISESAYNARDLELTYQYSSFGVPGLGLKRGLGADAVIAPYATALGAMLNPRAAAENFERLAAAGGRGRYGWYEALDYTPARLPKGEDVAIVRAYMAHHQGMTLVAIHNALHRGAIRARFHAEPIIQATELLLQERTPRDVFVAPPRPPDVKGATDVRELVPPLPRRYQSPHQSMPRTQLLSNGRYSLMINSAGSGYSRWRDLAVTRWREDVTCDSWGSYIFLRDVRSGEVWSAGYQPSGVEPDSYDVTFFEDRAQIIRRDGTIVTTLDIAVSPEDDAEVRRVSISNLGNRAREIELTSYAEVVLAAQAADVAHPAFSNMFVKTEFVEEVGAILAARRVRSPDEPQVWAAHLAVVEGEIAGGSQFETDRARFVGRGHEVRTAVSVMDGRPLSNTAGAVLDPIFSLRRRVRLAPGATARVAFWTLVAPSRSEALDLVDKHRDPAAYDRAITLAWTQAQVQHFHLGVSADEANLFQRLANHVLYSNLALRPSFEALRQSVGGPPLLWVHGISGDLPIVLCRIDDVSDVGIVRQLLRAHEYWRMKQLAVDLVILNESPPSYDQELQSALEAMLRTSASRRPPDGEIPRGTVFMLRAEFVTATTRRLLQDVARAVLFSRRGSLYAQVKRLDESAPAVGPPRKRQSTNEGPAHALPAQKLEFFNGLGGFADDGREYVTILGEGQWTPAPWINVIANPSFGFQVSAEGGGYTWSINSQQNQLSQWSNDPTSDRPGEVFYVRDEDSGALWCPTALPIREEPYPYVARHGQGYSRFEHASHAISLELLQYVPLVEPIKISRLKIANRSKRMRRLSVTAFVEWVMGVSRSASAPFIVTEVDPRTRAMLATNHWSAEFGSRVAFADLGGRQLTWTGDRTEFLGRDGTLARPAALERGLPLSNRVGAGLDPCCALQTSIVLDAGETAEIVFFLGEASSRVEALSLIARYRAADLDATLLAVSRFWDDTLCAVQVKTPDRAADILLNRWLLYQTLACRVWARSAFYQASGAYGFRDQLQDVAALSVSKPTMTREHLVRAAARQFVEGDVQHWWSPQSGKGVRTTMSDDRVWLPYAVAQYIEVSDDFGVLDEMIPFLDGPALRPGEHESYFQPLISGVRATLYEHCARALDISLRVGDHGLPLIGTGDWNDGMNRVGAGGKGESIWLGWFLVATLSAFVRLADRRGDASHATAWLSRASALRESLEQHGWDGNWYRRAYFDDGTPLGSATNSECRIDSIAQSWAVISGGAEVGRGATAMAAVDEYLIRRDDGMVLLFTPPFDRTTADPGYIKGYPPGIRENGGQYTHAAIWSALAFAELGDGDRAGELFSLLNPINHSSTRASMYRYKVEPYVACADVYAEPDHVGRGGWTWYTGSAGWMYRLGLEWILGFRMRGSMLSIDPCVPMSWRDFEIRFRYRSASYEISVENPRGVSRGVTLLELDGATIANESALIPLSDDGRAHRVRVVLGQT